MPGPPVAVLVANAVTRIPSHGSGNSRNGYTPKRLGSEIGDLELATPRDRLGSFEPRLVPKGQRRVGGLSDMIISLYAGGMTIRDIQAQSRNAPWVAS